MTEDKFNNAMIEIYGWHHSGDIDKLKKKAAEQLLEISRLRNIIEFIKNGWWVEVTDDVEGQAGMGTSVYYDTRFHNTIEKDDIVVVNTKPAKVLEKHHGIIVLIPKDTDHIIRLKKGDNLIKVLPV